MEGKKTAVIALAAVVAAILLTHKTEAAEEVQYGVEIELEEDGYGPQTL